MLTNTCKVVAIGAPRSERNTRLIHVQVSTQVRAAEVTRSRLVCLSPVRDISFSVGSQVRRDRSVCGLLREFLFCFNTRNCCVCFVREQQYFRI